MKTCTLETEPSTRIRRRIVAEYDYRAEDGELLFQVCRYQPKDFRQRKPDGKGGWLWKTSGVRRVPFMLPELIQSVADGRTVYVPEGEKDCLALVGAGFTATCNPGGAGKWQDNYSNSLRGAAVVIIADKDASGRDHAADVANKLQGIADNVKIIEMPDIDGKPVKDAADFFDAGGVAVDLDALATSAPLFPCDPDFSSTKPKKTSHTTFRSHPFTSVHIRSHPFTYVTFRE